LASSTWRRFPVLLASSRNPHFLLAGDIPL